MFLKNARDCYQLRLSIYEVISQMTLEALRSLSTTQACIAAGFHDVHLSTEYLAKTVLDRRYILLLPSAILAGERLHHLPNPAPTMNTPSNDAELRADVVMCKAPVYANSRSCTSASFQGDDCLSSGSILYKGPTDDFPLLILFPFLRTGHLHFI
jgi:hypothetical protein